jgi:hypothetical protein
MLRAEEAAAGCSVASERHCSRFEAKWRDSVATLSIVHSLAVASDDKQQFGGDAYLILVPQGVRDLQDRRCPADALI